MNSKNNNNQQTLFIFLQTLAKTDSWLDLWLDHLLSNYNLELGQNPVICLQIEADLRLLHDEIIKFDYLFDFSLVSLSQANFFFDTVMQLEKAKNFIVSIRSKAYGSDENTQECIAQLNKCLDSVKRLSKNLPFASLPIQH